MSTETTVLSVRMPKTFKNELRAYCKSKGINTSDLLRKGLSTMDGELFEAPEPDANLSRYLISVGSGSLLGIVVYKAVHSAIEDKFPDYEPWKVEAVSVSAAVASAMLIGWGVSEIIKVLSK